MPVLADRAAHVVGMPLALWPVSQSTASTMNHAASLWPSGHLAQLDNQDLGRLAILWRIQGLRGNARASAIASAFEAEQRRRLQSLLSLDQDVPIAWRR